MLSAVQIMKGQLLDMALYSMRFCHAALIDNELLVRNVQHAVMLSCVD